MTTLKVEFQGICTHFFEDLPHGLPALHRVVLVKAHPSTDVRDIHIGSHEATLQLNGAVFLLEGVRLSLEMASGTAPGFHRHESFYNLPNLTNLMTGVETLSRPSPFVFQDSPSEVACFFDISFGTLHGGVSENDAAFAILEAHSDQDFILTATPFAGTSLPPGLGAETRISQDTTIVVANVDRAFDTKTAADFLLHYKTAEHMPLVPQIAQPVTLKATLPQQVSTAVIRTIGAGCSNSNYP